MRSTITGMSAEWIAVVIALVAVGVSVTVAVVSGFRRLDDRVRAVETRLDNRLIGMDERLRDVETRLDARLRDVEARLDDRLLGLDERLRNVETELAYLSGRRQEDDPELPAAEPAPARAGQG